jgi:hypothetical protein
MHWRRLPNDSICKAGYSFFPQLLGPAIRLGMNATRHFLLVSLMAAGSSLNVQAEPIDALTGTYAGTLVREHKLVLLNTSPERSVKFKQTTRVVGFGFVPTGNDRTLIRLILPARDLRDSGVDREVLIDFQADPPTVTLASGLSTELIGFPTVTVNGKTVIVETSLGNSNDRTKVQDDCKLRITRTKPEPEPK